MAELSGLNPAAYAAGPSLTLASACENRCTPRWKPPYRPWPLVPAMCFGPAAFSGLLAVLALVYMVNLVVEGAPPADYLAGLILFLAFLLGALLVALPGVLLLRRPRKIRRHVLAGDRTPVNVYYARTNERNPTVAYRPHRRAPRPEDRERAQPSLLLVTADGRMWTTVPDIATFWNQNRGRSYVHRRNNPWIAPLYALLDRNRQPAFDQAALAHRELPVDLQGPAQEPVRAALATLGQSSNNDPRFVGGPVPGELLMSPSGRRFRTTYGKPVVGG